MQVISRVLFITAICPVLTFPQPCSALAGASEKPHAKMPQRGPREHNIALVLDATYQMNNRDQSCGDTRLNCLLEGVQVFLRNLRPCRTAAPCNDAAGAADVVSLFVFPNVTVSTAALDYACDDPAAPIRASYTFPPPGASSYSPLIPPGGDPPILSTYQIVDYTNNYRISNRTKSLNEDSSLVRAAGGKPGCGMKAPGGVGSYFAGAIYAAQASLVAEQTARPGSQNVLIFASDGWAASSANRLGGLGNPSGDYPSSIDECGQAIRAAREAAAAGTKVYSVALDSQAGKCPTDTSGDFTGITACQAMKAIASAPGLFYSLPNAGSPWKPCISTAHRQTDYKWVFAQIARSIDKSHSVGESHP